MQLGMVQHHPIGVDCACAIYHSQGVIYTAAAGVGTGLSHTVCMRQRSFFAPAPRFLGCHMCMYMYNPQLHMTEVNSHTLPIHGRHFTPHRRLFVVSFGNATHRKFA